MATHSGRRFLDVVPIDALIWHRQVPSTEFCLSLSGEDVGNEWYVIVDRDED
jgi:hypothetical protein